MRRWMMFGALGLFLFAGVAQADTVETKQDGVLSGKIMSDDGQSVTFKDAKGRTRVFKKQNVIFEEKEDLSKKIKVWAREAWEWLKKLPKTVRKTSDQLTDKFIGSVGPPLDRSAANAKADQLAKAMDDAGQATAAMTRKVALANAEIARQKKEGFGSVSSGDKKGHFSSLDN